MTTREPHLEDGGGPDLDGEVGDLAGQLHGRVHHVLALTGHSWQNGFVRLKGENTWVGG